MHEYGRNWRIKVCTSGTTFVPIGGEGSWSKRVSNDGIDLSSKDDTKVKAQGFGPGTVTFSVQGKVKLPDEGIEKIDATASSSTPEVEIQLVKGSTVKWQGMVGVGNLSLEGPNSGAVSYSFDLSAIEDPSIDDLAA